MDSFRDVFGLFPNNPTFSRAIGVSDRAGQKMRERGLIPPRHWPVLIKTPQIQAAGITLDMLARFYNERSAA